MMGHGLGYYGGFGMGGGFMMMIIGFLAIGFLFYLALKKQNNGAGQYQVSRPAANTEALEIAKGRLARGEISVEEFEQIKTQLL